MSIKIANTIGIVEDVLQENHSDSTVDKTGDVDFLVGSVGASVTVSTSDSEEVTDTDIKEIKNRVSEEITGRIVIHKLKDDIGEPTHWFELEKQ